MRISLSILLLSLSSLAFGQAALFEAGNKAYQDKEYELAISYYDSIAEQGYESAALYYNLANAHYQLGALAPAILNYEKALYLKPGDEEVKHNLKLAEQKKVDRFEELPPNLFKAFRLGVLQAFSPLQWAILALVLLFLASLGILIYFFSSRKRLGFVLGLATLALGLFSYWMSFQHQAYLEQHPALIVMSDSAYVKSGPGESAEDLFILHAGTKAEQVEEYEGWVKVRLIDGKIGWLPQGDLAAVY